MHSEVISLKNYNAIREAKFEIIVRRVFFKESLNEFLGNSCENFPKESLEEFLNELEENF